LIEYKMEIVERTTYYVKRLAIREFHSNMLFVTSKHNFDKFSEMRKKLDELKLIKSVRVTIEWKVFESQPMIPQD